MFLRGRTVVSAWHQWMQEYCMELLFPTAALFSDLALLHASLWKVPIIQYQKCLKCVERLDAQKRKDRMLSHTYFCKLGNSLHSQPSFLACLQLILNRYECLLSKKADAQGEYNIALHRRQLASFSGPPFHKPHLVLYSPL